MKRIARFKKELHKLVSSNTHLTDEEISRATGTSIRSTQRYLANLKSSGILTVTLNRHFHHAFGWCNQRTLQFNRSH